MYSSRLLLTQLAGLSALVSLSLAAPVEHVDAFGLKPFVVNISKGVPRMLDLVNQTRLPDRPEYAALGSSAGIALDVLKRLQTEWTDDFDWHREETDMNKYNHFTAHIEGLTVHFIHQRSSDPHAIPLLLNHGWPGSFLEFLPVISNLTDKATTSTGKPVSFHVVVPSLPGFAFSSPPLANWTVDDTARVWNTLMTRVLGYKTFATFGTDWGAGPAYSLYDNFNTSTRAAHFAFLPFFPLTPDQLAEQNITLSSSLEQSEEQNFVEWTTTGNAYFMEQTTKPNTIGLALQDNPGGQLAWMGEKFISWSDPRAGTPPSLLNSNEILRSVSLYYLTRSFLSSVYIYFQNPHGFKSSYTKAQTDAPLLFSSFRYNVAFWPPALVEQVGNLVLYKNHEFGGHFPGLDNPPALVDDLREIGNYWV
ncbi:alpha/beta-hydrolase [Coniochaeta ligniaria NRRL 30616]|uniref:Alpha/beta-hydrolase n=1 Tax=Coniochaeta ligniaria NRRL 30616 TaxID=1408157 RepID=A0A1J7JKY1_9PEZI|nr:alpha/beta-hydrolase [Coniochaeta ligniaria NRRL 30616]